AEPITVPETIMDELELKSILAKHHITTLALQKGKGCEQCAGTGYKGRVGVFEILEFSDDLKTALLKYKEYDRLRPVLMERGFKPLREDAVLKWAGGVTTAEEIFRVT
ncbi:MAG TPA: hypothetical protein VK186_13210, partial [Candidatus Deferrimicrobium sp.]|nr:hypothetical protein [Candidatus Deferrimicrobium sp.]